MPHDEPLLSPFEFRQRRLYFRLTQQALADRLGLKSGDTVKAWENSKTPMNGPAALAFELVWRLKRRGGPVAKEILDGLWP